MKTIFQKIIDREISADILYEDDDMICIRDKFPQAKVHVLLISKKRIPSIFDMEEEDYALLMKMFRKIKDLVQQLNIVENYRIVINRGRHAGQTIFHFHIHLLGGERLHENRMTH